MLATTLLLVMLWRGRRRDTILPLIIASLAAFGFAVVLERVPASGNPPPSSDLEPRVRGLERDVATLKAADSATKADIGVLIKQSADLRSDISHVKDDVKKQILVNSTNINNRINKVITINHLVEHVEISQPPSPPAPAKVWIASARVGRHQGKPVVYMSVRNAGLAAVTISGSVSFCPATDQAEVATEDCTSAPTNEPTCSQTFLCPGSGIAAGQPSGEKWATIQPAGLKSFRILAKLCDASSASCVISLTKNIFKTQSGLRQTLAIGDFVSRSDYDPKSYSATTVDQPRARPTIPRPRRQTGVDAARADRAASGIEMPPSERLYR